MKRLLIFNAVPTNNGDAALLFSLYHALKKQGYDIKIATRHFNLVKDVYTGYPFIGELTDYEFLNRLPHKGLIVNLITSIFF